MSSNSSTTESTEPPAGLAYIAVIQPSLSFILVGTTFMCLLLPILILLFLFSTPTSRKHPVFLSNVLAISVGIIYGILNDYMEYYSIVYPLDPMTDSYIIGTVALSVLSPIFIDSILLFRIVAFYPRQLTSFSKYVLILALPVTVKTGRFIVMSLFLHHIAQGASTEGVAEFASSVWPQNHYMITEWSLAMVDNLYSTSFFLWKLGAFYLTKLRDPAGSSNTSFLAHVRNLLVMALGNFIFPFFLTVTQIILNMQDTSYVAGSLLLMANLYVNILGVIFATVWASGRAWGKSHSMSNDSMLQSAFSASPGYISDSTNNYSRGKALRGTRTGGRSGYHTETSGRSTVLFANGRTGDMQTEMEDWELGKPPAIQIKMDHEVSTDLKRSDPSYNV